MTTTRSATGSRSTSTERRPRPWADWLDQKLGGLFARATQFFFLVFALVCPGVASKIRTTAEDAQGWVGFSLVILAGLACLYVALRARRLFTLSDWLDGKQTERATLVAVHSRPGAD